MADSFTISSEHQSFTDRQKSLFEQLETAEKNVTNSLKSQAYMEVDEPVNIINKNRVIDDRNDARRRYPRLRQYKSRESIFKRPEAPIARCLPHGRTPGFRKNPNKWTKYTLEDVKDEDMSDRSNTQAALAFLKDLEMGRADTKEKLKVLPEKIVFKKSAILKMRTETPKDTNMQDKPLFKNSKVVMPEYVVGQTVKKDLKKKKVGLSGVAGISSSSGRQLKLDHLDEEEM